MTNVRFSVLIPVYNVELYLRECLDSVINQTFKNFEVILINDGSTDSSLGICEEYRDKDARIKLIDKQNEGLLITRRKGISLACGQYCIFLDSDDYLDTRTLELLDYQILKGNFDMIIFNLILFNNETKVKKNREVPFIKNEIFRTKKEKKQLYETLLYTDSLNNLVSKCIDTKVLKSDKTDYFTNYYNSYGEDIIQTMDPVDKCKNILFLNENLYYYRQSDASMTKNISMTNLENQFKRYNPNVYFIRKEYAQKWGFTNNSYLYRLQKQQVINLCYLYRTVLCKCTTYKLKCEWISYDWKSVLPKEVMDSFNKNNLKMSFMNSFYAKAIFEKKYFVLFLFDFITIQLRRFRKRSKNG